MTGSLETAFQSKSIWQEFLLNTPAGFIDVDFKSKKIRCSASLVQGIKLTPETLPHTLDQWLELYHPDDYARSVEFRRIVFEGTEKSFSLERRLYCGDGQYRWFRLDAVCIRNKKKKIECLLGVETDISEDRRFAAHGSEPDKPNGAGTVSHGTVPQGTVSHGSPAHEKKDMLEVNSRLLAQLNKKDLYAKTLEKQVHTLTQMLDAAPGYLFHRDADGRLDFRNKAFSDAASLNPDFAAWAASVSNDASEQTRQYTDVYGRQRSAVRVTSLASPGTGGLIVALTDVTEIAEMEADMARLKRLAAARSLLAWPESAAPARGQEEREGQSAEAYFTKYLDKALQALFPVSAAFPGRASQLEALYRAAGGAELEVGVIGITSSGKSTFINAMMGERLLPEETRATTNLLIRCRKGEERSVTIVSQDGGRQRVAGAQLTVALMETLTSERMNPLNEQGVAFLEWTSPGAALPDGLVLVDTPGLDACGFPEHSELVMRRLLPDLDIVLYITSIRNRFKTADIELLEAVLEQNQRVIFLLSQIDLERDDLEGGKVVLSRRQKLSAYVRELRADIENCVPANSSLKSSAIVPVSAKLALAYFYDRESTAWGASNFGYMLERLEEFRLNLGRYRLESRAKRALTLMARAESDLNLTLKSVSAKKDEIERSARPEKVRELRDAHRWASAEVSAVRNEWRRLLDPEYHLNIFKQKIKSANTVKGIKDRYQQWGDAWTELSALMTARMDRARHSCRDILQKHGVSLEDRSMAELAIKNDFPDFVGYVFQETQEVRVRGWFQSLEFWPRRETVFRQEVDREKMLAEIEYLLSERLRLLNGHLSWWEDRMREDFCDPLYRELAREEAALADVRRVAAEASLSRKTLHRALSGMKEAARGIRGVLFSAGLSGKGRGPEALAGLAAMEAESEDFFARMDELGGDEFFPLGDDRRAQAESEEYDFFAPLLTAFYEQNIQSRFLELDALLRHKRIALLGLRRHDSLRLLSRLAHDASFSDSLRTDDGGEIDERAWLFYGSTPPALPHVRIALPDTLLNDLEILVAPSDGLCRFEPEESPAVDWNDIFAEWLPVIHIDIARIDSGLSDLARAPYTRALANVDNWVAASGQGALFNSRLADLLTDVPDRLELFIRHNGYRGRAEWFVYENYDARYTDFMLWGRTPEWDSEDGDLVQKWIGGGHGFKYPFTEQRLRLAFDGARRKSFKTKSFNTKSFNTEKGSLSF